MTIQLDDNFLETKLLNLSQQLHIKIEELVKNILLKQLKSDEIMYQKKDVRNHIKQLDDEIIETKLTNPFSDIKNIKEYSDNLRKDSWR